MVFRLRQDKRSYALYSLILAILFCIPYICKGFLPIEHDTFFHVARIASLADSIREGNFLPCIFPYQNNGYGYGSPMFYSNLLLIPFAFLNRMGLPVTFCYKLYIFVCTFFTSFTILCAVKKITGNDKAVWIAGIAYVFSPYRITDVYVRGALGEVTAMIFLPVLLEGMFAILHQKDTKQAPLVTLGLCGLILSHNLTAFVSFVMCAVFFLCEIKNVTKETFLALFKSVFMAFLLTCFYTLPMIEQLKSQRYYLNYYAESSDLAVQALPLWKYFAYKTVFGYGANTYERNMQMVVNIGYFLQFGSLSWLFVKPEVRRKNPCITKCLVFGMLCLILPSTIVPWDKLAFLRVLQFPWRLMEFAMVLLVFPACAGITECLKSKFTVPVTVCILAVSGLFHITPVFTRTFGIPAGMNWEEVKNGALCDPCYSASYVRVELAGGDYIPMESISYKDFEPVIRTEDFYEAGIEGTLANSTYTFTVQKSETLLLPITWYKGYHIYRTEGNTKTEIPCSKSSTALVECTPDIPGTYICIYKPTGLRIICNAVSVMALAYLYITSFTRKRNSW